MAPHASRPSKIAWDCNHWRPIDFIQILPRLRVKIGLTRRCRGGQFVDDAMQSRLQIRCTKRDEEPAGWSASRRIRCPASRPRGCQNVRASQSARDPEPVWTAPEVFQSWSKMLSRDQSAKPGSPSRASGYRNPLPLRPLRGGRSLLRASAWTAVKNTEGGGQLLQILFPISEKERRSIRPFLRRRLRACLR